MAKVVDIDQTRRDIRHTFELWNIDRSEFEIEWEEERDSSGKLARRPGAIVRYVRNDIWQEVACYGFPTRAENLRQCFLLLDRLRIAEQHGVRYQGLTYTKELAATDKRQPERRVSWMPMTFWGSAPMTR